MLTQRWGHTLIDLLLELLVAFFVVFVDNFGPVGCHIYDHLAGTLALERHHEFESIRLEGARRDLQGD